jgi:hypothetical protein
MTTCFDSCRIIIILSYKTLKTKFIATPNCSVHGVIHIRRNNLNRFTNILLHDLRFGTLSYTIGSTQDRARRPDFNFKMCFYSVPLSIINKTGNVRINVTWGCVPATIVTVGKQYLFHVLSVCVRTCARARVCVALGIQRAKRKCRITFYDLSGSNIFFHIISEEARFSEKWLMDIKCVFCFSIKICLKHFSL